MTTSHPTLACTGSSRWSEAAARLKSWLGVARRRAQSPATPRRHAGTGGNVIPVHPHLRRDAAPQRAHLEPPALSIASHEAIADRYQKVLQGIINSRHAELATLRQRLRHARSRADESTLTWADDMLDGFRFLVLSEATFGPLCCPGAAGGGLSPDGVAAVERWLGQVIDEGGEPIRLAAILFYEAASLEVMVDGLTLHPA